MKILLLGNTGQLGWELNRTLLPLGEIIALDYPQINMASPENIRSVVREHKPTLIINATAFTDVDRAEREVELATAINSEGPGVLAEEAKDINATLIHYSTDYVFDGTKGKPYTEEDQPTPLSVYGKTKVLGEQAVQSIGCSYLIFRTSWVYSLRRPCFVTKVLQWARQHETLRIVDDQISSPTWARMLAESTGFVIAHTRDQIFENIKEKSGLYHITGGGSCSRYEWAKEILAADPQKDRQITQKILPAKSIEFKTSAERPLKSLLNCDKFESTFGLKLSNWKTDLMLAMAK